MIRKRTPTSEISKLSKTNEILIIIRKSSEISRISKTNDIKQETSEQ